MELRYSFDPERFYLGTLCKHEHRWPGTDLSLRKIYKSPRGATVNHCVGCTGRKKSDWLISFIDYEASGFPPGRKLGKLCPNGHRWENTEMSLRYDFAGSRHCVECERVRNKNADPAVRRKYNEAYIDRIGREEINRRHRENCKNLSPEVKKERSRKRTEYKRRRREELRAQGLTMRGTVPKHQGGAVAREESTARAAARRAEAEERRRQREEEKRIRESDPNWAEKEREKRRLYHLKKYETDPEYRLYHRQKSKRRKAQERGSIGVHVKGKRIRERFAQFGHQCAYCGATGDLQIEHLIPIAKGGAHVLGNILPACQRCNYSKTTHEAEAWYRSQPFFCERRWQKIRRVLGLGKGAATQLSLL
jgi:5-methylcytosine-specific restriction endonuclease McrA